MRTTPATFKSPQVTTIVSPVGVDKIIQALQLAYQSNLTWLEKSFGRAFVLDRKTDDERNQGLMSRENETFPAVWQGDGVDMINVLANDNLNAYSFFVALDSEEPQSGYQTYVQNTWTREIDNIFWLNLKRIDSTKTYLFAEELKEEIKGVIKSTTHLGYGGVEVVSIFEKPSEIFNGFTLDLAKMQNLNYPYHGFRFRLKCWYRDEC